MYGQIQHPVWTDVLVNFMNSSSHWLEHCVSKSFTIIITRTTQTAVLLTVDHSVLNSCFHNPMHTFKMRTRLHLLVLTRMSQRLASSTQDTVFLLRWHISIVVFPTSLLLVALSQFCHFADQLASMMISVTFHTFRCHSFAGYDKGKH